MSRPCVGERATSKIRLRSELPSQKSTGNLKIGTRRSPERLAASQEPSGFEWPFVQEGGVTPCVLDLCGAW